MNITNELIENYFTDKCTPAEAEAIAYYLLNNPDILEQYAGEYEYVKLKVNNTMDTEKAKRVWNHIAGAVHKQKPARTMYRNWMAAASIAAIVIISLSVYLLHRDTGIKTSLAAVIATEPDEVIINKSDTLLSFVLKDGSLVQLSPFGELQYAKEFPKNGRTVKLKGQAFFDVAQNRNLQFSVEAGGLRTTALGTSFWIDARNAGQRIHVRLITGKVMVNASGDSVSSVFKRVYLQPGQMLTYSQKDHQLLVKSDVITNSRRTVKEVLPSIVLRKDAIVFYKRPLREVFTYLAEYYKTTIVFDEDQVDNMYFSGNYRTGSELESILQTITFLNNLQVKKTASGFRIQ